MRDKQFVPPITRRSWLMRTAGAAAILGVAAAALWQAGILFRGPGEDVTVTTPGGGTAVIQIRAADTSVETPGATGLKVGLNPGDLAPDFEASSIEGDRVRLSDFRGKAVYLNFWASWCTPCRAEMPDIIALLAHYEAEGLVVLAMNAGEAYGAASGFVEDLQMQSLTAIAMDPDLRVAQRYRVSSMPTSIFIDADGAVTRVHPGFATAEQMDEFARQALHIDSATGQ